MNMNTKANRRKLVRALFTVPRQRLDSRQLPRTFSLCLRVELPANLQVALWLL